MKKNNPPLIAPVPVNVQRAGRPPLVSSFGEKLRAPVSQAPCGSSISPNRLVGTEQGGERGGWMVYYMSVSLTRAGQMGPTQSLAACALLTCVWVFMQLSAQHGADINKGK